MRIWDTFSGPEGSVPLWSHLLFLLSPRLMLGFMGVTAFLSMWISNTATTAMMVPIVQAVLDQLHGNVDPEPSSKSQNGTIVLHQEHQEKTISNLQTAATSILEKGTIDGWCWTHVGQTSSWILDEFDVCLLSGLTQGNSEKTSNLQDNISSEQKVSSESQIDGQETVKPTPQDKPPSDSDNTGPGESTEQKTRQKFMSLFEGTEPQHVL